ncbi:hypothetical protein AQUCO_00900650v1 [Aquilegia coerulea]|uniref:Uncharacterized protein n=1 Tax=Aquilegia coerulea TaxID=218851 RepID=A0A2G5EER8_AQUCA|nr:hypothetical protein AQUCO_00900650v1 [Aquilegia coerulea]
MVECCFGEEMKLVRWKWKKGNNFVWKKKGEMRKAQSHIITSATAIVLTNFEKDFIAISFSDSGESNLLLLLLELELLLLLLLELLLLEETTTRVVDVVVGLEENLGLLMF